MQSASQVGLSTQEMQDFVRRAMREFGYSNARSIPRVGRQDVVSTVIGFIECWRALQAQSKPVTAKSSSAYNIRPANLVNHSDGGFLLRFNSDQPSLCVGTLLCLRGNDSEPWTVAAVRWLEDSDSVVHVRCEALCNFADARIGQTPNKSEHLPVITFVKNEANAVICGYDAGNANSVSQLVLDSEIWIVAVATELGEDWQLSAVLDVTR